MSGGRKEKYNLDPPAKKHSYSLKMDDDEYYRLEELVEATGKTKSEVLKHGIALYYHVLRIKRRI